MENESESQEHGQETSKVAILGDSLLWCFFPGIRSEELRHQVEKADLSIWECDHLTRSNKQPPPLPSNNGMGGDHKWRWFYSVTSPFYIYIYIYTHTHKASKQQIESVSDVLVDQQTMLDLCSSCSLNLLVIGTTTTRIIGLYASTTNRAKVIITSGASAAGKCQWLSCITLPRLRAFSW